MQRFQLFLFSIISSMLIFQYEPLMTSKGITNQISLQVLTIVQIIIVVSIYIYQLILNATIKRNTIIRLSLLFRIVVSLFMYITKASELFILLFIVLQVFSTGLDIYFESSIMTWVTSEKKDFGKYRMFGSLGYATSGFWLSIFLMVVPNIESLLLVMCIINIFLLITNFRFPIPNLRVIDEKKEIKKRSPIIHTIFFLICTLVITLPNSFGYILNSHLRNQYSLAASTATFYVSIAVFLGSCISEMYGFYIVDKVIQKQSALKVVFIGVLLSLLRWGLAILSPSSFLFVMTYLVHGISFSFIFLGSVHFINQVSKTTEIGTISMKFTLFANILNIFLAQVYSIFLPFIGTEGIIWIFFFICVMAFPTLIFVARRVQR